MSGSYSKDSPEPVYWWARTIDKILRAERIPELDGSLIEIYSDCSGRRTWDPQSFERMMQLTHLIGMLIGRLSRPGQLTRSPIRWKLTSVMLRLTAVILT